MTSISQRTRREMGELRIGVSRYDRVAGLMVSLLILLGTSVALMFIIWLTATLVFRPTAIPVKLVENVAGRGDRPEGFARDLEAPGLEEMPELAEPQLEASLEAVTETVSSVVASLDVLDTIATTTTEGVGGLGDSRPRGPLGEGDDIIPRWERWEIRWTSTGLAAYARQLDFFRIELGAAGGKPNIDYARRLGRNRPDTRQGSPEDERRLYMTWKGGTLAGFDRQLLERAGIATRDRLLLQFYPEEVEDQLALLEMRNAGGRPVQEFLKTVFEVQDAGRGFAFVVTDQQFRVVR